MTTIDRRLVIRGLAGTGAALLSSGASAAESIRLTFVLTNDIYKMNAENGRGGLPKLAAVVRAERAKSPNVIVSHAGDTLSPSLMSGFDQGAHMIALFNALGLDVFAPGNHEWDFGPEIYRKRMSEATFPVLAANVREIDGSVPAHHRDTMMIERSGIRIGLIGTALDETAVVSASGGFRFAKTLDVIPPLAKKLREEGAHLVVAVVHAPKETARRLMASRTVDLILLGHNHDLNIDYDGRVSLTESGQDADYVTCVDVDVDLRTEEGRQIVRWRPNYRVIDSRDVTPDPEMLARVKAYEDELSRELDVSVATLGVPLDSASIRVRSSETAMGNFIADALRVLHGTDVALINGGGIRGNRTYEVGRKFTRRDILTELPFGNKTVLTSTSGEGLKQALENGFSGFGTGRFPQVSGMKVVVDRNAAPGSRVVSVEVGGAPLDLQKRYTVATHDFIARGGDGYTTLKNPSATDDSGERLVANDVMVYARRVGTIEAKVEGRIVVR